MSAKTSNLNELFFIYELRVRSAVIKSYGVNVTELTNKINSYIKYVGECHGFSNLNHPAWLESYPEYLSIFQEGFRDGVAYQHE